MTVYNFKDRNTLYPVFFIILFSFSCNIPTFFTFVGTDIGVYYEVSRVLYEQGKLALFGNYWDHKPILIYLWFLPFHWFDTLIPYSSLGLRIGAWLLYCINAVLIYIGFFKVSSLLGIVNTWKKKVICLLPALFYCSISFSTFDYAQNNILSMASFALSFTGFLLTLVYLYSNHKCLNTAVLAGFLSSSAFFFRPTGIAGILACIVISLVFYKRINISKMIAVLASILVFFCSLLILTILLGTSWKDLFNTLLAFNLNYAGIYQNDTSVLDFLTFNKVFFTEGVILILLILGNGFYLFSKFKTLISSQKIIISAVIIWGIIELSIALILQRKIMGFYLLAPLYAIFCIACIMIFISILFKERAIQTINTLILVCCIIYFPIENFQIIPKQVYSHFFASQEKMPTAEIVKVISSRNTQGNLPRIFIFGNRANLYSLAALKNIYPYNWVTYANVLAVEDFMPQFKEKLDEFKNKLQQDPPDFIVYAGTSNKNEIVPNIYYRVQDAANLKWFDAWVKANYVELKTISSGVESWPYGFEYKVFQSGNTDLSSIVSYKANEDIFMVPVRGTFFVKGWHALETNGSERWRWTDGKAILNIYSDKPINKGHFSALIHSFAKPQTITVHVNGVKKYEGLVGTEGLNISFDISLLSTKNTIEISSDHPAIAPKDMGYNADDRKLAFSVRNITIQ